MAENPELPQSIANELAVRAISGDIVATPEAALLDKFKSLIELNGVPTTLNGDEDIIATKSSYTEKIGGRYMYLRGLVRHPDSPDPRYSLAFSESLELPVVSDAPEIIQFVDTSIGTQLLQGTTAIEGTAATELFTYTENMVDSLLTAAKSLREIELATVRLNKASRIARRERRTLKVGASLAALLVVGVGAFGFEQGWYTTQGRYDHHRYSLPIGETARIGGTITPDNSQVLSDANGNGIADAPKMNSVTVTGALGLDDTDYTTETDLTIKDGIREFVLSSTEPGQNCVGTTLTTPPPADARVAAWTASRNLENKPRNDEFRVTFLRDRVRACWVGHKIDDNDRANVYVQMLPANK